MQVCEWEVCTEIEHDQSNICHIPKACEVVFKSIKLDLVHLLFKEEEACNGSCDMQTN
jgi:hypothetical protein